MLKHAKMNDTDADSGTEVQIISLFLPTILKPPPTTFCDLFISA